MRTMLFSTLFLAAACLMSSCGTISKADETVENTRQATEVLARRLQQADQKIEEATAAFERTKQAVAEKVEAVQKVADSVTAKVEKVTDKVGEVSDKVTEKIDKVKDDLEEKIDEVDQKVASDRIELEKIHGAFDQDGDGKVSIGEGIRVIKEDSTDWNTWITVILSILGVGGASYGAMKGKDKAADWFYQKGRERRLERERAEEK